MATDVMRDVSEARAFRERNLKKAVEYAEMLQPMQRVRLMAAIVWLAVFIWWLRSLGDDLISLQSLRALIVLVRDIYVSVSATQRHCVSLCRSDVFNAFTTFGDV